MRIGCPYCGARGVQEFLYHGDATVRRPADGGAAATADWVDYVYFRNNPDGVHQELWYHTAGCRAWLVVTRDLRSHEILSVAAARDVAWDAAREA
jgi:sarcosine oxidase subunit delta